MKPYPHDTKKVFWKCGACSHAFFYLLNREFGHFHEQEEGASDPLAGGILQRGHQCGMLWGASLAVGAEAYRRTTDKDRAGILAVKTTRELMRSFRETTDTVDCREITGTDFSKPWQMFKYLLFKTRGCFNLAEQWAPQAIATAQAMLEQADEEIAHTSLNCASETARRMGATDEQQAMVAGFAGGMGLEGHSCGALAAAIWMNSLDWMADHPGKSPYNNPSAKATLKAFENAEQGELLCRELCGRQFTDLEDHARFLREGGCAARIERLAKTNEQAA